MIWEDPSSILTKYFTAASPLITHPEEIPVKFLGVSRVWNEVKYDLKGDHEYDAPVSPIN